MKENRTMLVSVGGSPKPIIWSIEQNRPERLIFFVSRDSYTSITVDIMPALMERLGKLLPYETVLTPNEQDVGESTFALLRSVPEAMRKLGAVGEWPALVDFTGGTKVMSAAVVWAASRFRCTYSYVGSDSKEARTKGGLGIVIDGRERALLRENPWDEVAWFEVRRAVTLYNNGQYSNACSLLAEVVDRVSDERRVRVLALLLDVWGGFAAWDAFDHTRAVGLLKKSAPALAVAAYPEESLLPGIVDFAAAAVEASAALDDVVTKKPGMITWAKIADLMSNSMRRAELEQRYDDAVARCYAAVEKYGKYALQKNYGINNSKCRPEQLPDGLREEYRRRYADENSLLRFGLQATYTLLAELGDKAGVRYRTIRDELEKQLTLRNDSILGHGFIPISEKSFRSLFELSLQLMGWRKEDLTVFPRLEKVRKEIEA